MKKLIYGICFAILSCTTSQITSNETSDTTTAQFIYKVIIESEYGGSGSDEWSILNEEEFKTYWTNQIDSEIPNIDFDQQMVIIKNFESQRMGGSLYQVQNVKNENSSVEVYYTIRSNTSGMATQAITSPVFIIQTTKINQPTIKFIQMN